MNNLFTNEELDHFFEQFKQLPEYFELEKVHQIINNPESKAKLPVKTINHLFKIIFMTTTFITSITVLAFLFLHDKPVKYSSFGNENKATYTLENKATNTISGVKINPAKQKKVNAYQIAESQTTSGFNTSFNTSLSGNRTKSKEIPTKQQADGLTSVTEPICDWPEDTVLDKNNLILKLTKEELERIGYFEYEGEERDIPSNPMLDAFKTLYNYKYESIFTSGFNSKKRRLYAIFNTLYLSDTSCTSYRWNSPIYKQMDTLVPVLTDKSLYWYVANSRFLDSLPLRYKNTGNIYKNLKCLKNKYPDSKLVNWNNDFFLGNINYLELSREELENIGVIFKKDSSGLDVVNIKNSKIYYQVWNNGEGSSVFVKNDTVVRPFNIPILGTDEKGLRQRFFNLRNKKKLMNTAIADLLIPVKIPINKYVKGHNYYDIYWYNPTDSFINLLPERYRSSLKTEKDLILSGTASPSTSSCTYFEACKSTLQLDGLKVYPNPAALSATVQFSVDQDITGCISIENMAGVKIRQLTNREPMSAGFHSYTIDLSGLPSGIFIIVVDSDKGFKTTRLIISK